MDKNYKFIKSVKEQVDIGKSQEFIDYRSDNIPTWCPGCGYFGITKAIHIALADLKIKNENLAIISGIGCIGRFGFFQNAYAVHCLHGRAAPFATGVKSANDKLTVLVISGDGDSLAIGTNHFIHTIRRNIDITYLLFDNNIYGLTKGQTSPTSPKGLITKTSPYGNEVPPVNPVLLALANNAKFVARSFAGEVLHLSKIIEKAILFKGLSFIHMYSPCVTFDKQNILWKSFSQKLKFLEKNYDHTNYEKALIRAKDDLFSLGIFYEEK